MRKKFRIIAASVCSVSLLLTSCNNPFKDKDSDNTKEEKKIAVDETASDSDLTKEFNELCNDVFIDLASQDALTLNYLVSDPANYDIDEYPTQMISYDSEDYEVDLEEITEYFDRLNAIDYEQLSYSQQITYDTLYYYLLSCTKLSGLELYYEPLGPTLGFQAELPITLAEYTFYTAEDIDRYLTALPSVYDTFVEIMEYEQIKADNGLFMSDKSIDGIIEQCEEFISNTDDNYLITSFDNRIDNYEGLSSSQKEDYKKLNKEIVLSKIIPAYQLMIDKLDELRGSGTNDGGLCNWYDGKSYYKYLIYSDVGDDISPTKMKEQIQEKIDTNLNELYSFYLKDSNFFAEIADAQIASSEPKEILSVLYKMAASEFPEIDEITYSLKSVDKSLEDFLSPAMYYKPPVDTREINSIYINNAQLSDNISFFVTLSHEGYPGHMYQFNYEKDNDNQALRQAIGFNGISEGWAEYVEFKAYKYIDGLSADIAEGLALNTEISIAVEAITDIGVNYEGWTVDDVYDYVRKYFTISRSTAEDIYQSCIETPANVLCYVYGAMKFQDYEDQAIKELDEEYDPVEFHKFILDVGFTCFPVVDDRFERYYLKSNE